MNIGEIDKSCDLYLHHRRRASEIRSVLRKDTVASVFQII